jgi:ATP-dependent DNA ligase
MEARLQRELPSPGAVLYEPKWDGFRCIAFRDGDEVYLQSKSGQPLARYFPEIAGALRSISAPAFVLDGELVVPVSDRLDFDQLLQRIHPAASRVKMLARDFPASYLIFDLLVDDSLHERWTEPLRVRRQDLERFARFFDGAGHLRLSPATQDPAIVQRWLTIVGGALDGIIAKDLEAPYASGRRDAAVKVKRMRTADCVIGGYRVSKDGQSVASLLLGLYDEGGSLEYVGFTSGLSASEKRTLLKRLTGLRAASAFTGRSPGGPSRWNRDAQTEWFPIKPELVLEVEFDHVSGGRFRHGTRPLRFRPDKPARQCTMEQLQQPPGRSPFTLAAAD